MTEEEIKDLYERKRCVTLANYDSILRNYEKNLRSGLKAEFGEITEITTKSSCDGRYSIAVTPISCGKGYFGSNLVEILLTETGENLGFYIRDYGSYAESTFHPFVAVDGKDYALFSENYTATSVMSLPDCKKIGGEKPDSFGFCPTDYFTPNPRDCDDEYHGEWALISGCVWGDDSSWKVEYLNLRNLPDIIRDGRLGYVEMPGNKSLADIVEYEGYGLKLQITKTFDVGEKLE